MAMHCAVREPRLRDSLAAAAPRPCCQDVWRYNHQSPITPRRSRCARWMIVSPIPESLRAGTATPALSGCPHMEGLWAGVIPDPLLAAKVVRLQRDNARLPA
jgi:hypothetical protein